MISHVKKANTQYTVTELCHRITSYNVCYTKLLRGPEMANLLPLMGLAKAEQRLQAAVQLAQAEALAARMQQRFAEKRTIRWAT